MNFPIRCAVLTAIALPALEAVAQVPELNEILVSTQRLEETIPQDLSRYGNRVEIITAQEIAERGFVDITQTLQMLVPGLHISPKNGPFDYFDASLQGSRNQEILWLIDGVRITNRLYNGTSPLDTVPAHMVERIEVLKGGQGIFYGTQSVGGVVNIVTKGFQNEADGAVGTAINSNDGYNINAYYRGSQGDHQFVVFGSKDDSEGYTPWDSAAIQPSATDLDRGYKVNTAGLKYAWNINQNSRLSLQYLYTDNEVDFARPYLNNNTVNDREEDILTLKYDLTVSENIELFIKAYQHNWDTTYTRIYNTLDANGALDGGTTFINNGDYWGYEDSGINAMAKFNYGGNFEYVLGVDRQSFSGEDDVWRIGDQEENVTATFGQIRSTSELFDRTTFALGVRGNKASNMDDSTVWNLTGKHYFNDNLYVQGNVGTSFRLPDAEALFLNEYYDAENDGVPDGGWFAIGNPKLEPEESENINIAIGGNLANFTYELTAFSRDITNYIDSYVPLTIAGVVGESFINSSDEVNMDGLELITTLAINESWTAHLSHTDTKAQFNGTGAQLTSIPETETKFRLDYRSTRAPFGVSLSSNLVGDINGRRGVARGDYIVTDVSAFYSFGADLQHQLVLRIENIQDEEYATRIDRGTLDLTGQSYLFENLGMQRTGHLSYTYSF
ncbi:MAG: TonB-dependent receptor [Proteobacteria bacterium]|nr:TonB-dependent receptor [Pseudomonadota bacterium]